MFLRFKNKTNFLLYLFATGLGDGLFFIGVGKLLSRQLHLFLGVGLLFILNEFSKLLFQFVFSSLDKKFSLKKAIIFSEIFQSIFLFSVVIFSFDVFSVKILLFSLIILNFFDGLSKVSEFNLTLEIFSPGERKKFNSLITTVNQTSRIGGFIIGGLIISYGYYELLFMFNAISFLISSIFALHIRVQDKKIEVKSSWKEVFKKENRHIILYTFIIASNTVILSSNSILGFKLSVTNTKETILYQIANAIGSFIAAFVLGYKILRTEKKENTFILIGLCLQGFLFLGFTSSLVSLKLLIFIVISSISFFNLSIYITKLQDYSDLKFGSKVYSLRQLNRSLFNAMGVFVLSSISSFCKIQYQFSISIFCFLMMLFNYFFIKKGMITYIASDRK
ncbi:MAG TPA: MFS transporter [Fusobacterium sp.]|uniref:MFS transporter n=1 Tax=Fusobacterium sp. TaxID=68766 RepID=UPI002F3E3578